MGVDVDGLADLQETLDDIEDTLEDADAWFVGTAVEYAIYLEFGTSEMDPKPFIRPAVAEARADLSGFIRDNTRTTLAEIDDADELVRKLAFALERRIKEVITEKGLVETGTLRASITAAPAVADLPDADDVAASEDFEVEA